MIRASRSQRGAALIVSLLMLTVMTLLGVTAIRSSNVNLRIVNNVQSQKAAHAMGQNAIEQVLSDIDNFNNPKAVTVNATNDADGYAVAVAPATCMEAQPVAGYSAKWPLSPLSTAWELVGTVTDDVSGAQAVVHQGVRINMTAGSCP